jgi:aryl-alcohol dehydrogenase-like predicted oxidoreductase
MNRNYKKLVIGTAQFGMTYGIANKNGQVSLDEVSLILNLAKHKGINTIDTAKSYGRSEEVIGEYIRANQDNIWEIITKLGHDANVSKDFNDSARKMNNQLSAVLAHSTDLYLSEKYQSAMDKISCKGMIKTGVSVYNEVELDRILSSSFKPDMIQLPMNILDTRLIRSGILSVLYEIGIEVHVRSVFLQGLFYLSQLEIKNKFHDAVTHLDKLRSIALSTGLTLAELSLRWVESIDQVSKIVLGVDNSSQLKSHLKTLDKEVSSSAFWEILDVQFENESILNPSLWP